MLQNSILGVHRPPYLYHVIIGYFAGASILIFCSSQPSTPRMNPPRKRQKVSFACQRCRQRKLGVRLALHFQWFGLATNPRSVINSVLVSYVYEPVRNVYPEGILSRERGNRCRKAIITSQEAKMAPKLSIREPSHPQSSRSRISWI